MFGPTAVIAYITYPVPQEEIAWEKQFWSTIGFLSQRRTEPKKQGYWLNGGGIYLYLDPIPKRGLLGHLPIVTIVPRFGLESTLKDLDRLPFRIHAKEMEDWWGSRRVRVMSPSSYVVELLEHAPPASFTDAP